MPNKKTDKPETKKYDQYKKALLEIKDQVVGDLKVMKDESTNPNGNGAGDVSGHALHMADVATDMYDREFNLGLASNDRETLSRVNDALQRISEGAYGNCIQCNKPIAAARLKAIPYVETCVKCQEELESKSSR
ncbi:MAG: TraR/DksA C4-type zinc finger protein [Candidatus Omnitrophica bacterium]|nr:TraR/DksA C4-type zinc finger protein [Candidatus Omnitrophota bacterium]